MSTAWLDNEARTLLRRVFAHRSDQPDSILLGDSGASQDVTALPSPCQTPFTGFCLDTFLGARPCGYPQEGFLPIRRTF